MFFLSLIDFDWTKEKVNVVCYSYSNVPEEYKDAIRNERGRSKDEMKTGSSRQYSIKAAIVGILDEHIDWLFNKPENAFLLIVIDSITKEALGYIGCFLTHDSSLAVREDEIPVIQGICKTSLGFERRISLNEILMPTIESFLKDKGYDRVYCDPIDHQREILITKYHFNPHNDGTVIRIL